MKGVIFNLLERVVSDAHGEDTWDDLLDDAGCDGAYTSIGSYPDEELFGLVGAASVKLGQSRADLLRWFGRSSMPILGSSYPEFFEGHTTVRTFLLTINDVIHAEVLKIDPEADVPSFGAEQSDEGVCLVYSSARRLCALAEGLILGAGDRFGESVTITQPECMLRGDDRCMLNCLVT